jgi:hypothetical protein
VRFLRTCDRFRWTLVDVTDRDEQETDDAFYVRR